MNIIPNDQMNTVIYCNWISKLFGEQMVGPSYSFSPRFTESIPVLSTWLPRHRRIIGASLKDHPWRIDQRHLKRRWRWWLRELGSMVRTHTLWYTGWKNKSQFLMAYETWYDWVWFIICFPCLLSIRQAWSTFETTPSWSPQSTPAPWSPVEPQKKWPQSRKM